MDSGGDIRRDAGNAAAGGGRVIPIAMIVVFDIAAPLVAYRLFRSDGMPAVTALLLSGVFPVAGVIISAVRNRRPDVVGAVVLAGIAVGTIAGLVSHDARLLLIEGSVPTAVLGVACLGSLRARRPLFFSVVLEFTGPDSAKGREMTRLWQQGYGRIFRVITAVWGTGFLVEAALRVVIVYNTSTGTALAFSKVMPFVTGAILSVWTLGYSAYLKRRGARSATAPDPT